jgi:hypothetical protein
MMLDRFNFCANPLHIILTWYFFNAHRLHCAIPSIYSVTPPDHVPIDRLPCEYFGIPVLIKTSL